MTSSDQTIRNGVRLEQWQPLAITQVLTFGPMVVASLRRRYPSVFLDVHLAVEAPHEYVDILKDAGANQVLFHPQAVGDDPQRASQLVSQRFWREMYVPRVNFGNCL